jgi:EpsD family peptidyl-prolyl cis-trans isomerase
VRSELLAQQAVNKKLDRSPEFILAMHEARRQVLAGLAEKSITETVKPLSPENIRKIVSDNPQFFAGRKLLVYEEVMIPGVDLPLLQSLNLSANNGASLDQLIDQLKAKKVQFRRIKLTQTSDRLEPAIFKVLSGSKQGVPLVARVEDKFAIILLLQSMQSMPLEGAAAEQAAGAMVFSRQKNMVLAKKLTELTDAAKIAYFGEFASEVSVKQGVKQKIALPAADPERITATWHRQLKMVALLIISYASVMMLFSASMRLLKGTAWLPRILSASESNAVSASSLDLPYQPGLIAWSFIIGVACLSVFALGYQLFLIWSDLLLWQMIAAVLTGLLSGIAGSYLFVHSPLRLWTRNVRGLPVLFFALLLLISVMVTNLWFTVLF